MLHRKTWVVVANGCVARIFTFVEGCLTELTVLTHPETRVQGHNLVTDRPGLSISSVGFGRHAMEPHLSPQENEAEHFVREVARYLELEYRKNQFTYLYLIASPAFLGLLKQHLHTEIQKAVVITLDKDLVKETPRQIRSYLP